MITGYTVLLTLHILCAVAWVGGSVMLQVIGQMTRASGDRRRMHEFAQLAGKLGAVMFAPLSVGVLLFGIFLVSKAGYDMSDGFVGVGYLGFVVSLILGMTFYPRAGRKREEIAGSDGIESDAYLANYMRIANVSLVETTVLLIVVICMAIKPGV